MSNSEKEEEIILRVSWSKFVDEDDEDWENEEDAVDPESEISALVIRLSAHRFRLARPTSVTFAGPLGAMLNMGDVIEVIPLDDGTYKYVRTLEPARIWSRIFGRVAVRDIDEEGLPRRILDQFHEAGGAWEWVAGNLIIQAPLQEGESEPPAHIKELFDRLCDALPVAPSMFSRGVD